VNDRLDQPTRREFIALTGAAALGAALPNGVRGHAPKRVALVGTGVRGTGMWGRDIVEGYSDVVEFVGLSDINPGRLAYAREYMGIDCPVFTDFDEMMRTTEPEVLLVTTMDSTHDQFIVSGMQHGADIVTEKPFTTDEVKLQRILDAQRRTGRDIVVTHNYRYSPHRLRLKQLLMEGRIGRLTSVDFHWYLDIYHGAAYFRRWHGKERFSGTLFVHKACHHFDLLNWWIDSEPQVVFANGALDHYGHNNDFRSTNCRGCPHRDGCDFYWDITEDQRLVDLYVDHEHHDGYLRDGCVWSNEIDIFDKMSAQIRYMNGVDVSYSCTTYSPYEGYRIAFNGTEGRLEAWIKERQPWESEDYDELRVTDNFGSTELIRIPHGGGGHGGGDQRLRDRIFRDPDGPDPYEQAADARQGAMAVLIGFAARRSARSGEPVEIASLSSLVPRARR
jgi:predicted dehydrogenase